MHGAFPVHFLFQVICSTWNIRFLVIVLYVIRCQDPQLDGDEFVAGMLYWIESHYLERPSSANAFFPSGKPQWCGIVPMASREGAFAIRDVEQWDDHHVVEVRESSSPILEDEWDPLRYWTNLEEWIEIWWLSFTVKFSEGIWTDTHQSNSPTRSVVQRHLCGHVEPSTWATWHGLDHLCLGAAGGNDGLRKVTSQQVLQSETRALWVNWHFSPSWVWRFLTRDLKRENIREAQKKRRRQPFFLLPLWKADFAKFCFQILESKDALESISIVITRPTKILLFFSNQDLTFSTNQKRGSGFPNQGSVIYI